MIDRHSKRALFLERTARRMVALDRVIGTDYSVRLREIISGNNSNRHRFQPHQWSFCRLPKTGSTSVIQLLGDVARDRCNGLGRHVGVSRHCPPGRFTYFTFLRDPVDRVWSHYQMVLRRSEMVGWGAHVHKGFEAYCRRCWEARNMMTAYLTANARRKIRPEHIEAALANLRLFGFVGFLDRLDSDVLRLLQRMGISTENIQLPHRNSSAGSKRPLTDQDRQIAEHYNKIDIELYRHIRQEWL